MIRLKAHVQDTILHLPVGDSGWQHILIDSPAWFKWLRETQEKGFAVRTAFGSYSAYRERKQRGGWYWVAMRRANGKLHKAYLGKIDELTLERLFQAARALTARAGMKRDHPTTIDIQDDPLLETKLHIPTLTRTLIVRQRLIRQIERGIQGRLMVISAPAGFGKTTLLASWLAESQRRVAWLSLDEGDTDPLQLLRYLIAALRTVHAGIGGKTLSLLQAPQNLAAPTLFTTFVNELATSLTTDVVLVVDDYHALGDSPGGQLITWLVDKMPSRLHLVITTREEPELPIANWRARGQLTELRLNDLRFTVEETSAYLQSTMRDSLAQAEVKNLNDRTEGWIAGLQLASLTLQTLEGPAQRQFLSSFGGSHQHINDYLFDQVFSKQSEAVKRFLVQIAILDSFNAELCGVVTGDPQSRRIMAHLKKTNLFVLALDKEGTWFRFHNLFREFLRGQLNRLYPERIEPLYGRAAVWYLSHGILRSAVEYALHARDYAMAAQILDDHIDSLFWRSTDFSTWLTWIKALPGDLLESRPHLELSVAWASMMTGQIAQAEATLRKAENASLVGQSRAIQGELHAARLSLSMIFVASIAEPRDAQALAEQVIPIGERALAYLPEDSLFLRSIAMTNLAIIYDRHGQTRLATQQYARAFSLGESQKNATSAVVALYNLGSLQFDRIGALTQAESLAQHAIEYILIEIGSGFPLLGWFYILKGRLYLERNALDLARQHIEQGLSLCQQWMAVAAMLDGYIALARLAQATEDWSAAMGYLSRAEGIAQPAGFTQHLAQIAAQRAEIWLFQGNLHAAEAWATTAGLGPDDALNSGLENDLLVFARLLIAQCRFDEALTLSSRVIDAARGQGRNRIALRGLILQALACYHRDDSVMAMSLLEQALSLAQPEGYLRMFLDEGHPMARILDLLLSSSDAQLTDTIRRYVQNVARAFTTLALRQPNAEEIAKPMARVLYHTLNRREMDVLQQLATGQTVQEIGVQLSISTNTVKTHLKRIYEKLDAHNRVHAITRAREIGLLE